MQSAAAAHLSGRHGEARLRWRDACVAVKHKTAPRYDAPGDGVYAPSLLRRLSALALGVLRGLRPVPPVPDPGVAQRLRVPLGRASVQLLLRGDAAARTLFVNLHENEQTSVRAALRVLQGRDERLLRLQAQGRRLVLFWLGWRPCLIDPNRIFSSAGLRATLAAHASDSTAARAAVAGLRDALLRELLAPQLRLVVALHNSGLGEYSLDSYAAGGSQAADARALHRASGRDVADFFLVTRSAAFDALSARGFNVVLQAPGASDDGSLAWRLAEADLLYVNVEARHGQEDEQVRMLQAVLEMADAG